MGRQVDLAFGQLRAMHEQITEMSAQTDELEELSLWLRKVPTRQGEFRGLH